MVFSSIEFLYFFLPAALILHALTPKRFKNLTLLLTGLFFYAYGEPVRVILLVLVCAVNWLAGLMITKYGAGTKKARLWLILATVFSVGSLAVFKYTSFIIETVNSVFGINLPLNIYAAASNGIFGTHFSLSGIVLPIGISFFTFQSMSYTFDVYRKKAEARRNFVDFAAYVAMFPQIVAGPIVLYSDIADRLDSRRVTAESLSAGVTRFTRGLAKKVLLANNIGRLWAEVKAGDVSEMPVLTAWLGIAAFTLQIYFDFSGYSDMAIGLGKMLGFDLPENFDLPYTSKSVREFWRRWHITLGRWFRDYVYFPLGGSRCGALKTVRNLMIVWLLTGLWHGASLNFIVWGCWFGVLIIMEHFIPKGDPERFGFLRWLVTMLCVMIGWVIFDTESLSAAAGYIAAMFGRGGAFFDRNTFWLVCEYSVTLSLGAFFASDAPKNLRQRIDARLERAGLRLSVFTVIEPLVTVLLLAASTAYLVYDGYNPFLYFNF